MQASLASTTPRKKARPDDNGRCVRSEAELRQADVEIFRCYLMSAIVEAKCHVSANAVGGHGTGQVSDIDGRNIAIALSGCTHDRDALECVALVKPAPDRSPGQRKGSVAPAMEMDDRRQVRDTVLRFGERVPEYARKRHGAGEPVARLAKRVPGHGGALRESSDERIGAVESEPLVDVVEDPRHESTFIAIVSRRIRMRPGSPKSIDRDEGEAVIVCDFDQRSMPHLQFRGASIAVKEDIDALHLFARELDQIGAAFDGAWHVATARTRAGADAMKADSGQNCQDSASHASISLDVTATDVAPFPPANNFAPVHVVARGI